MATQPTLGGVALPHPQADSGYSYRRQYRGGRRIMADGSTAVDLVVTAAKHEFTLRWTALSLTDLIAVRNGYDAAKENPSTFLSPENVSYTVSLSPANDDLDISVRLVGGGSLRYDVTLHLREE